MMHPLRSARANWKVLACMVAAVALPATLVSQAEKKFLLQGRILDEDSRLGVPSARIQLSGGSLAGTSLGASTDQAGRFSFSIPAGTKYRARIEKAGYFDLDYGREIEIQANDVSLEEILLTGKRAISGVVHWRNGEPPMDALVVVSRVRGGKLSTSFVQAVVDDRGQFRIPDLQPGRYVVHAAIQGQGRGTDRTKAAVNVFYPGTARPQIANAIDLRRQREPAVPLSFVLDEAIGVTVSGLLEPTDDAPNGARVSLGLTAAGLFSRPFVTTQNSVGDRFELPGVPPGKYDLIISTPGAPQTIKMAAYPIVVTDVPIDGLRLAAPRQALIEGTIDMEETAGASPLTGVRVSALSEAYPFWPARAVKTPDENGRFQLGGTVRGQTYSLTVQNLPSGVYIASATQAGKELAASALTVMPSDDLGPVRIRMRNDGGSLTGTVRLRDRTAASGFVALAPKNRAAVHKYRTAIVATDGSYRITSIAPGQYSLLALERNYDDDYLDPLFWDRQSRGVRSVEVNSNGVATADLELVELR
ncbi:MAG: carboxypeptidase regulatory-like domain-containing protein [Acidobacteriota bacterium]